MTANPAELVVMLYDACIKNMKLAQIHIEDQNIADANKAFQKAQDILAELVASLDFTYEISQQLLSIYDFVIHELIQSNIKKDISIIPDLVEIMSDLRDAWAQIRTAGVRNSALYEE